MDVSLGCRGNLSGEEVYHLSYHQNIDGGVNINHFNRRDFHFIFLHSYIFQLLFWDGLLDDDEALLIHVLLDNDPLDTNVSEVG